MLKRKPKPIQLYVPGYISQAEAVFGGVMFHVTVSKDDFKLLEQPSVHDYLRLELTAGGRA